MVRRTHMNHVGPTNDYGSGTPEFAIFRYGIHKISVIIWVRFRSPFVLYKLDHDRLYVFLFMLFKHDHYYNHNHNLLLLKLFDY